MRRWLAGLALLITVAVSILVSLAWPGPAETTGPAEVVATIDIRFSRFAPAEITAIAGRPLTITLRNNDPIEHEWIVGPPALHDRHRIGSEPYHDELPTEVTLPPFTSKETTVIFNSPGRYEFICHLPGHEAYGMRGVLVVKLRQ